MLIQSICHRTSNGICPAAVKPNQIGPTWQEFTELLRCSSWNLRALRNTRLFLTSGSQLKHVACRSPMFKGLPIVGLPRESEGLAIDTFT